MNIKPIVCSTSSIASFILPFTDRTNQLITISPSAISVFNISTFELVEHFPFDLQIELAVPLIENEISYIILQQHQNLIKLHYQNNQIYTDLLKLDPKYQTCCYSSDLRKVAFISQNQILTYGQFQLSNPNFSFETPRYAIFANNSLIVLFADSLHQVWIQSFETNQISPPMQVQEDIWHISYLQQKVIALGPGISMVCDLVTSKQQAFTIQNANILSICQDKDQLFLSDCIGNFLQIRCENNEIKSEILLSAVQAATVSIISNSVVYLGAKSGDSVILDLKRQLILKRLPSIAPIHDISCNDGNYILACGMERTGSFKLVQKMLKSGKTDAMEMNHQIIDARQLYCDRELTVFQVTYGDEEKQGTAIYQIDRNYQFRQLNIELQDNLQIFCMRCKNAYLFYSVSDRYIFVFQPNGSVQMKIDILEKYNQHIIYCRLSENKEFLVLTLTGNCIVLFNNETQDIQQIELDYIPTQLLQASYSKDDVFALLFDQVPYIILYKDGNTAIDNLHTDDLLDIPPDIDIFYLLSGSILPNKTRPALIALLKNQKLVACPFSQDSCQCYTGVVFMEFCGNSLYLVQRSGEVAVYQYEGIYCLNYQFFKLFGAKSAAIFNDSLLINDDSGQQYYLTENGFSLVYDGSHFAIFNTVVLAHQDSKLLFLQDIYESFQIKSQNVNALARSVVTLNNGDYVTSVVKTQDVSQKQIAQSEKAVIMRNLLVEDSQQEQQIEFTTSQQNKRLYSVVATFSSFGIESYRIEIENAHVTKVLQYQQYIAVSGIFLQNSEEIGGFVNVYDQELRHCGHFYTKKGVYLLEQSSSCLLAGSEDTLLCLKVTSTAAFLPPQTHAVQQENVFEIGYLSICVFMTSLSAVGNKIAISDLAKGIFTCRIDMRAGRAELTDLKRYPGKGNLCLANDALIMAKEDGRISVYSFEDGRELFQKTIGVQILCFCRTENEKAIIYGTSSGELGEIQFE